MTRRATVKVFDPASTRGASSVIQLREILVIYTRGGSHRKHLFQQYPIVVCLWIRCLETGSSIVTCVFVSAGMFTEPLPSTSPEYEYCPVMGMIII
jgi:hypothetical protein